MASFISSNSEFGKHRFSLRFVFLFLLKLFGYILVPSLLILGIIDFSLKRHYQEKVFQQNLKMEEILSELSSKADPVRRFDSIFSSLTEIGTDQKAFWIKLKQVCEEFPKALEVYRFSSQGKCEEIEFLPKPTKFVANKFLKAVIEGQKSKVSEKWLKRFSGYSTAHISFHQKPNKIIKLTGSNERFWGGWFKLKTKDDVFDGHLIVFIKNTGVNKISLLRDSVAWANSIYGRNFTFGWIDPYFQSKIFPKNIPNGDELRNVIESCKVTEKSFKLGQKYGLRDITESGMQVFALSLQSIDESHLLNGLKSAVWIFGLIALVVLSGYFSGGINLKLGLRAKLTPLFLFGAAVPISILIMTGIIDRDDQEKILVEKYQNANLAELTRIDEGMGFEYSKIIDTYKKKIEEGRHVTEVEYPNYLKDFDRIFKKDESLLMRALIVGKSGKLDYYYEPGQTIKLEAVEDSKVGAQKIYCESLLKSYRGEYTEESIEGGVSLRNVITNTSRTFARNFLVNSGGMDDFSLLSSIIPTYCGVLFDSSLDTRGLLMAFHSREGCQRNYLLNLSKSIDKDKRIDKTRLAAIPVESSARWPAFPKRKTGENERLKRLAELIMSSGLPRHEIEEISGKKYLLSGMLGKNVDGYVLIMARPYQIIRKKIDSLNKRLFMLSAMILFIAVFSGWLTSSLLLKPVSELRNILASISSGDFRVRAPFSPVAEFSLVNKSLNMTLEKFQELKVAKSVQEQLWPENGLRGEGWSLEGVCKTATDLGGDHFEWFELDSGKILITVGDVSGHGVASAMVQASTKVWMALKSRDTEDPSRILGEINRLHFEQGVRKLPMTCWVGIFDPVNRKIEYASAGQSYPIFVDANGNADFLKLPGMPLGVRKKFQPKNAVLDLSEGGNLVLYTDGLVETPNYNDEILGYDRFIQICSETIGLNAGQAMEYIFAQTFKWDNGNKIDDQTVVVLNIASVSQETPNES